MCWCGDMIGPCDSHDKLCLIICHYSHLGNTDTTLIAGHILYFGASLIAVNILYIRSLRAPPYKYKGYTTKHSFFGGGGDYALFSVVPVFLLLGKLHTTFQLKRHQFIIITLSSSSCYHPHLIIIIGSASSASSSSFLSASPSAHHHHHLSIIISLSSLAQHNHHRHHHFCQHYHQLIIIMLASSSHYHHWLNNKHIVIIVSSFSSLAHYLHQLIAIIGSLSSQVHRLHLLITVSLLVHCHLWFVIINISVFDS